MYARTRFTHLLRRAEPHGLWCCSCCLLHMCICLYRPWWHLWSARSRWTSSGTWKKNRNLKDKNSSSEEEVPHRSRVWCALCIILQTDLKKKTKSLLLTTEQHSRLIESLSFTRCLRDTFIEKDLSASSASVEIDILEKLLGIKWQNKFRSGGPVIRRF